MKVKNMKSERLNNIPNQFIIEDNKSIIFQSYNTIICKYNKLNENFKLDKYLVKNPSRTTLRYLYKFMREETQNHEALNNIKQLRQYISNNPTYTLNKK